MLGNEGSAGAVVNLLSSVSAANTAAATSAAWLDVRDYEGDLVILQNTGAITGTLDGKIQDATDSGGTGAADVTGATATQVTTASQVRKIVVPAGSVRGWIKYVGTVGTGPVLISATLISRPKIV